MIMKSLILTEHTPHTVAIRDADNGQLIRVINVDGEIVGGPSVSGNVGYVSVKKGSLKKTYVIDLQKGTTTRIFTT